MGLLAEQQAAPAAAEQVEVVSDKALPSVQLGRPGLRVKIKVDALRFGSPPSSPESASTTIAAGPEVAENDGRREPLRHHSGAWRPPAGRTSLLTAWLSALLPGPWAAAPADAARDGAAGGADVAMGGAWQSEPEAAPGVLLGPLAAALTGPDGRERRVAIVFGPQDEYCPDMGAGWWQRVPAFCAALRDFGECYALASGTQLLSSHELAGGGVPWAPEVAAALGRSGGDVRLTLPAALGVQYGQLLALRALGVTARAVAGCSAGELAAAFACGALSLQQLCCFTAAKAAALRQAPWVSAAYVDAGAKRVQHAISDHGYKGLLNVRSSDAPQRCTITSSLPGAIEALARSAGLVVGPLQARPAAHGPAVTSTLPVYFAALRDAEARCQAISCQADGACQHYSAVFVSTAADGSGEVAAEELRQPLHWASHLHACVDAAGAVGRLQQHADLIVSLGVGVRAVHMQECAPRVPHFVAPALPTPEGGLLAML